jgi:proline dehydrogenase
MLDATSKALFHGLAQIPTLQRLASKYGMAAGSGFARRFIAGESIEEAVECVKDLPGKGLLLTLDYLGESVSSSAAGGGGGGG